MDLLQKIKTLPSEYENMVRDMKKAGKGLMTENQYMFIASIINHFS